MRDIRQGKRKLFILFLLGIFFFSSSCGKSNSKGENGGEGNPVEVPFPHPDGFGDSDTHITSIYDGSGELADFIGANCALFCHGDDLQGGSSGVGCGDCHELFPHSSIWGDIEDHPSSVLSKSQDAMEDCRTCHGDDLSGGQFAPSCQDCHQLPTGLLAFQHDALQGESCDGCHQVDGDLVLEPPDLCQTCHDQGERSPTYSHSVVNSGKACVNCHSPHESNFENLSLSNPSTLCYTCHDEEITSAQYGNTENILSLFMNANSGHTKFLSGECETCHDVHGAEEDHLTRDEPKTGLCLTCHDRGIYVDTQLYVDSEPDYNLLDLPTEFLKTVGGSAWLNLHYKHITIENLDCVDCHNPHAAEDAHMIVPEENYLEATFSYGYYWLTGNCTGCHLE